MTEFLFCCTTLIFLVWVIYLQLQIQTMKENMEKLKEELHKRVSRETESVRLSKEDLVCGSKPNWVK